MRRSIITALAALFALLPATPASAQAAVQDKLTFTPTASGITRVEVSFPGRTDVCPSKRAKKLVSRYRGTLQIVKTANGRLAVIDSLTFDEYLRGLSEVPRSWPEEALKAQVIAARSYALYQLANPRPSSRAIGYDICSTDQCQVYRGVAIEQGAFGERWVAAVRDTAGLALVHEGKPIQAFYFSTSSGKTRTNKEVFGGSPLPYFKPVDGADDDAPLANWSVRVPVADLTAILNADGIKVPTGLNKVTRSGDSVTLSGPDGSQRTTASAVRKALNSEGPCLMPDTYPPRRRDGSKLPQTLPSVRYSVEFQAGAAIFSGRGWGHDVGMSQFGARSLASKGRSASDILAYYYGGLRPQTVTEPGAIKVLVADGGAVVRLTPESGGSLTTANGGRIGEGASYVIEPGAAQMSVQRTTPSGSAPVLQITAGTTTRTSNGVDQTFTLSGPARVTATVSLAGTTVGSLPETSFERGDQSVSVPFNDPKPGTYEILVEAYDGVDTVRLVSSMTIDAPSRNATPTNDRTGLLVLAGAALCIIAGVLILLRARSSKRVDP